MRRIDYYFGITASESAKFVRLGRANLRKLRAEAFSFYFLLGEGLISFLIIF
jgi:hypothetical protein